MRNVIAPQQVVANADYPYDERIARARELLDRMGIRDVKPLYAAGQATQHGASDSVPRTTTERTADPTFDTYWAGWALRNTQPSTLVAGNDHDGGR